MAPSPHPPDSAAALIHPQFDRASQYTSMDDDDDPSIGGQSDGTVNWTVGGTETERESTSELGLGKVLVTRFLIKIDDLLYSIK